MLAAVEKAAPEKTTATAAANATLADESAEAK
jgi:hypothetical protein